MPRIRRFRPALGAVLIAAGLQAGCSYMPSMPWANDGDHGKPAEGVLRSWYTRFLRE